ncbi:hypothetical protein BDR05DRAFT_155084 [Suillus weaverae]|nr:hypothetical protein BDR05DRAFT_155084 [Suillus weaverae]
MHTLASLSVSLFHLSCSSLCPSPPPKKRRLVSHPDPHSRLFLRRRTDLLHLHVVRNERQMLRCLHLLPHCRRKSERFLMLCSVPPYSYCVLAVVLGSSICQCHSIRVSYKESSIPVRSYSCIQLQFATYFEFVNTRFRSEFRVVTQPYHKIH